MTKTAVWIGILAVFAGCSHRDDASAAPAPAASSAPAAAASAQFAKPENGAPIAMIASNLRPAPGFDGKLDISAYNFSDRRLALYDLEVFYRDAAGAPVAVESAIRSESAHTSFTGGEYVCEPHSKCAFPIELQVPAKSVSATVVVTRVKTDDNQQIFPAK